MRKSLLLLAILGLAASALAAGVVYEIEVTDHATAPPQTEANQLAAEGRNLKMGIAAGKTKQPGDVIYRGESREMMIVDHDDKSYTVIDQEAIEQLAGQVGQMAAQLQEALKNVPAEQRAMVEKMMRERMPAEAPARLAATVRRTGEHGEKAGYPCVKYEVLRGDRLVQELWVTDWDRVEGGEQVRQLFGELAGFFKQMMDAFASAAGDLGGMVGGLGDSVLEVMDEIDGFPVLTRELDGGELESESILRSASRRTLDPAEFEPPAGYKRRSMTGR